MNLDDFDGAEPVRSERIDEESGEYVAADVQLHPTTGLAVDVDEWDADATDEQTREVVEAIRSPRQAGEEDLVGDDSYRWLPPLVLPGFGDEYPDCGDDLPLFCEDCGHVATVGRTCARSSCPRCGAAWCRDRGEVIVGKLASLRAMLDDGSGSHRFHHLALSPPDDWRLEADDVLDRTFQVIYDVLDALGIDGAYVFYHPWRGADGDDRGAWKDRQFAGREWEGDVRDELELGPHFHVICVADEVRGGQLTADVHEATGWVTKRITPDGSNVSLYDDDAMARAVLYCLSHTGLRQTDAGLTAQFRGHGVQKTDDGTPVKRLPDYLDHYDELVRRAAPDTLGVSLSGELCTESVVRGPEDGGGGGGPSSALQELRRRHAAGGDGPPPPPGEGGDPNELTADVQDPFTYAAAAPGGDGDEDPDPQPCEARMVHLRHAPDYLEDEEWRSRAQHVDELQTTWADWEDRLDEIVGFCEGKELPGG